MGENKGRGSRWVKVLKNRTFLFCIDIKVLKN
jgi:hypothetical protein